MNIAILKSDGTPVVIDSFINRTFDNNGFLTSFRKDQVYRYYQVQDFQDADKALAIEGYYSESIFQSYRMDYDVALPFKYASFTDLRNTLYNFTSVLAHVGDSITVSIVNNGTPYENYYDENQYTFALEALADGSVKKYKSPVYTDLQLTDYNIPIPASITPTVNQIRIEGDETNFYQKNFGSIVNGWQILDGDKQKFKKTITLICFQIHHIVIEIFPLLLPPDDLTDVYAKANSTTGDLSDLSPLQQVMFLLMQSWGWFYQEGSTLYYRKDFPSTFSTTPIYEEYSTYYAGVAYFYTQCYRNTTLLTTILQAFIAGHASQYPATIFSSYTPLGYLIGLLPTTALTILPFSIIQILFDDVLKSRSLTQNDQDAILKIVSAMSDVNIDPFMDYMLLMKDGSTTNFEIIYSNLNNAQLNNIPFVNIVLSEPTYKKYFCFALYQLWIKSKYNFNPPGATSVVNTNCFFLLNPSQYIKNSVLTFSSPTTTDPITGNVTVHGLISVNSMLNGTKITANVVTLLQNYLFVNGQWMTKPTLPTSTKYGAFHIFQPITLIGLQSNYELNIPKKATVPAFLFHYINEYDQLANFDAGVALAVDLTTDVLLAFFTGGESLADLVYFQYTGGLGQALVGTLPETESILVWQGVTATSQTISLSAGVLSQINDYLIATETDPGRAGVLLNYRKLFLGLILLTAGHSTLTQSQVINEAGLIYNSGVDLSYLSQDLRDILTKIYGEDIAVITEFGGTLAQYENVNQVYNSYPSDLKLAFWKDFKGISADDWLRLDGNAVTYMGNWSTLHFAGLAEATVLDFICDANLTTYAQKYISTNNLLPYLKSLTYDQKVLFLTGTNSVVAILTTDDIQFMDESAPSAMSFLFSSLGIQAERDMFDLATAVVIVKDQLPDTFYQFLSFVNPFTIDQAAGNYVYNIENSTIEDARLNDIYVNIIQKQYDLTEEQVNYLKSSNQYFTTTTIYSNGSPVQPAIDQIFVSGDYQKMGNIFPTGTPVGITDPNNDANFISFSQKAFDKYASQGQGLTRYSDTEMKYIFYFLNNYYALGDRFVFVGESTLYTCGNCQRYLQVLQRFLKANSKTLDIQVLSKPDLTTIGKLKKYLGK